MYRHARLQRLGYVGMALALFVQLALPFVPMPQMLAAAPTSLERAEALWGLANICLAPGERPGKDSDNRSQGIGHACPFCQLSQQIAGLLAPVPLAAPPPPSSSVSSSILASVQPATRFGFSAAPPRAPPLV